MSKQSEIFGITAPEKDGLDSLHTRSAADIPTETGERVSATAGLSATGAEPTLRQWEARNTISSAFPSPTFPQPAGGSPQKPPGESVGRSGQSARAAGVHHPDSPVWE